VRHSPVEGALKDMFELARFEAAPVVQHLMEVLPVQQLEEGQTQEQQAEQQQGALVVYWRVLYRLFSGVMRVIFGGGRGRCRSSSK